MEIKIGALIAIGGFMAVCMEVVVYLRHRRRLERGEFVIAHGENHREKYLG